VLDGLLPGSGESLIATNATPVLSSLDEVREWAALGKSFSKKLPAALQIDTGLNRLGLSMREAATLASDLALLGALDLRLLMSHLACADNPSDPKNEEQRAVFERALALFPGVKASLAASDGLMLGPAYHYDLVRPGYALYGGQAFRGGPTPVGAVVTVEARVLGVRDVNAGDSVGYSATWRAARPSRVAIIAAGYEDGFARTLSGSGDQAGGVIGFGKQSAPVIGRVSMDLITVDVTDIVPPPKRGDFACLIGPGLTIESMGTAAGTIGYEVLTRLGRRFHRVYLGDKA
jgi:alanine racemase